MGNIELIITLLSITVALALVTRRFLVPYPVIFVLAGVLLAFVPQLPNISVDPHLIFLLFVPPILFYAAYFTSWRDFRANLRPISLLALVLVMLTTFGIAAILKWLIPELPWSVGCVLGAIISPPDAIAATAITHRLKIPRRIVSILEGESLVNDASGLIIYKFAVIAVVTGSFSFEQASMKFAITSLGGIVLGLIFGWLMVKIVRRIEDVTLTGVVSLLTPFLAYIIAEKLELSGVLTVVVTGLLIGWYAPQHLTPHKRLRNAAVWETFAFVINGVVFILIGLHLPLILSGLEKWSYSELTILAILVTLTTIVIRFVWVFFMAYILPTIFPKPRQSDKYPPWRNVTIVAWTGMRGIVSLGAALALPLYTIGGTAFPARNLIIFLAFTNIIGTLVFQGLTLPLLIRWLGLKDDGISHSEERIAREAVNKAMLKEIERLRAEHKTSKYVLDNARQETLLYAIRIGDDEVDRGEKDYVEETRRVRRKMIQAGRNVLIDLRHRRQISDEVLHAIQAEFDLDEIRLS